MSDRTRLKRINVYVDPDDLERVAEALGCRPSDALRRLIDNYLLATEIDEVRRMVGHAPDEVFCRSGAYCLQEVPDGEEIEPVE